MRRALLVVVVIALIVAALLLIGVPVPIGDSLVLQPRGPRDVRGLKRAGALAFEIRAADGTPLRGWIVPGRSASSWLMLNYGNAADMYGMAALGDWFNQATGATVVMWDYRGFGYSGGKASVGATQSDALAVYDHFRNLHGAAGCVYGVSFGTTVAAHIAASRDVRCTILHAPPSDADTEFRHVRDTFLPWYLRRLRPAPTKAIRDAFAVAETMRRVHTPLLVLHGNADTLIPIDQGRCVERESGSAMKKFVEIPNAMHSDIWYGGRPADDAIIAFMEALEK